MAGAATPSVGSGILPSSSYLSQQMTDQAPQTNINLAGLFPNASSGVTSVLNQLQSAQNSANQANQQRYQDILGMYQNMGQSGALAIQQQTQQQQGQETQSLMSSGLGNSTITGAMSRGINQAGQQNLQSLQGQLMGQEANVMESMTQQAPQIGQYASLLEAASQPSAQQQNAQAAQKAASMQSAQNQAQAFSSGSQNSFLSDWDA